MKRQPRLRIDLAVILMIVALFASGCAIFHNGGAPDQAFDVDKDLKKLAKEFDTTRDIDNFFKDGASQTKANRDRFITGRLVQINIRYLQFVRKSTSDKQNLDMAVDFLTLSLNLAGASVGAATTKTILAGIAAGVIGTKTAIDKHYWYEKTVPALVAAMNAQRSQAFIPILIGMSKSLEDYPFAQAITDIHNYYFAGTYMGAILAIQTDAGVKESTNRAEITLLQKGSVQEKQLSSQITDSLPRLTDQTKINAIFADLRAKYPDKDLPATPNPGEAAIQLQRLLLFGTEEDTKFIHGVLKKNGLIQ